MGKTIRHSFIIFIKQMIIQKYAHHFIQFVPALKGKQGIIHTCLAEKL
jgi:hypothetical protein